MSTAMIDKWVRSAVGASVAVVLAMALLACGDDSEPANDSPPTGGSGQAGAASGGAGQGGAGAAPSGGGGASAGAATVVITEFMANPAAVADTEGEWIELTNPSTLDVDLRQALG